MGSEDDGVGTHGVNFCIGSLESGPRCKSPGFRPGAWRHRHLGRSVDSKSGQPKQFLMAARDGISWSFRRLYRLCRGTKVQAVVAADRLSLQKRLW